MTEKRIVATGCLDATRSRAQEFATLAQKALSVLPDSTGTQALHAVVSLAVNRGN